MSSKPVPLPANLTAKPNTFTERLMQPDDWPDEIDNGETVGDIVGMALEHLSPDLQEIAYAIFYERLSFAELAERQGCSKTQAWRMAQQVKQAVAASIITNPIIQRKYNV